MRNIVYFSHGRRKKKKNKRNAKTRKTTWCTIPQGDGVHAGHEVHGVTHAMLVTDVTNRSKRKNEEGLNIQIFYPSNIHYSIYNLSIADSPNDEEQIV